MGSDKPTWPQEVPISTPEEAAQSLQGFKLQRVLAEDSLAKTLTILCRRESDSAEAVVLLARRAFNAADAAAHLTTSTQLQLQFQNDVYYKYAGTLPPQLSQVNIDVICPASEKHISKHTAQQFIMVQESPDAYREVTLPFIEAIPASRTQWVHNILAGTAEADRVLHRDPHPQTGFVLLPDMKWDQVDPEGLYCVAICCRKDIQSLRDLNADHLPLLRSIKRQSTQVLRDKFAIEPQYLRLYVHYQPSYYHFHVHISHLKHVGSGLLAGKAHLLGDIIDNIAAISPTYYAARTLAFAIGEGDPLYPLHDAYRKRKALQPPDLHAS